MTLPVDFIVIAAIQELAAVRECLEELGHKISVTVLSNRRLETFELNTKLRGTVTVGLIMAVDKGKSQMKSLLEAIEQHSQAEHVLMVGMMAGIKGKSNLLDVVAPRTVFDGTAIGTKDGRPVGEPEAGTMDAKLHHWAASLETAELQRVGIRLIAHKKTVTVAAKIDDISHEVARAALAVDPENVVGIEMEASALTEQQGSQSLNGKTIGYLMVKGVADYAGDVPDKPEVTSLRSVPGINVNGDTADPTNDVAFKSTLQREATKRALHVALSVLKAVPGRS